MGRFAEKQKKTSKNSHNTNAPLAEKSLRGCWLFVAGQAKKALQIAELASTLGPSPRVLVVASRKERKGVVVRSALLLPARRPRTGKPGGHAKHGGNVADTG